MPPASAMMRCASGYMLENPVVSRTTRVVRADIYSDKVSGAENQQERLIEFRGWVIGFVDGEGCFSIGFVRQPNRSGRRGYRTGFQVSHEFAVTQGASGIACLEHLREFFGVGDVIPNRRYDNHREHMYRYTVRRRIDLLETIIRSSENIRCGVRSSRTSRSSLAASNSSPPAGTSRPKVSSRSRRSFRR